MRALFKNDNVFMQLNQTGIYIDVYTNLFEIKTKQK